MDTGCPLITQRISQACCRRCTVYTADEENERQIERLDDHESLALRCPFTSVLRVGASLYAVRAGKIRMWT
jgi:hypothetical protein